MLAPFGFHPGVLSCYKRCVDIRGVLTGFGFYTGLDHDFGRLGDWYATYGLGYLTHGDLPYGLTASDVGMPLKVMFSIGYRFDGK